MNLICNKENFFEEIILTRNFYYRIKAHIKGLKVIDF